MNARRISLVLAVGLLALALWVAFRPGRVAERPARNTPLIDANNPAVVGLPAGGDQPPAPIAAGGAQARALATPTVNPLVPAATILTPGATAPTPESTESAPGADEGSRATTRNAQVDADKVKLMLVQFRTLLGENPVGTNAEIMRSVMGGNPRQANLGPPEGMSVNGDGELIDQWGTPYFFHQLSKETMEIRSAGPDRKMYTADDVLLK